MSSHPSLENIGAIINPASGNADHDASIASLKSALDERILLTSGENDQEKIHNFYREHVPSLLIVGGGDGTIKMTADALMKENVTLAILPIGSANGLATEWDLSEDVQSLMEQYLTMTFTKTSLDGILINGHMCLHMADVGLNASMIKHFDRQPVRGFAGYAMSAAKELLQTAFTDKEPLFEVVFEDNRWMTAMLLIANCRQYGTGVIVNPDGRPDDGFFETGPLTRLPVADFFTFLLNKNTASLPSSPFSMKKYQQMKVQLSKPVDFQVDGEYLGQTDALDIKIIKDYCQLAIPIN